MPYSHIKGVVLILVLSFALALGVNALSSEGIPLKGQWDPKAGVVMADPGKFGEARAPELNNPLRLRRMVASGKLLLIDARPEMSYAQGHLPGALSFPLHGFNENLTSLGQALARELPVVVYCSGVACQDSHTFARKLVVMGVKNVMVYSGGFDEWSEMGFQVEKDEG
jgi:rhodanese-related sulfurtransferase